MVKLSRHLKGNRQHGDHDDAEHDGLKVLLHPIDLPEKNARYHHEKNPEQTSDDGIQRELPSVHARHACHKGRERPEDREEARHDDRLGSVLLKEEVRLVQVGFFQDQRIVFEDLDFEAKDGAKDCHFRPAFGWETL